MIAHQMPLDHREMLTAFETDDVIGPYRLPDRNRWVWFRRLSSLLIDGGKHVEDLLNERW